jgi:hypothetical protein
MISAYLYDFLPNFRPQYDLRQKYMFFPKNYLFFNENDPLNRFIHFKMQNYVSFCLKIASEGEKTAIPLPGIGNS